MSAPRSAVAAFAAEMGIAVPTAEAWVRRAGNPPAFQSRNARHKAEAALCDLRAVQDVLSSEDPGSSEHFQTAVALRSNELLSSVIGWVEPPTCKCLMYPGRMFVGDCHLHNPGKKFVDIFEYDGEWSTAPPSRELLEYVRYPG